MKHGDTKETFDSGAQRDSSTGKGRPSLISPTLLRRLAVHLEEGAKHYGDRNWEAGMPFCRAIDSLMRHTSLYLDSHYDEDHLAAIVANAMFLMQWEDDEEISRTFDDRPDATTYRGAPQNNPKECLTLEPVTGKIEREQSKLALCIAGCGSWTVHESGICHKCSFPGGSDHAR